MCIRDRAVVPVKRGACGGCFNVVPPQKQAEIREKKKIIVCEHCGRILSDVEDEVIEEEKPKRRTKRTTTKK
jgi:predicted  nucleic acid-binding Zn-ribbon protein